MKIVKRTLFTIITIFLVLVFSFNVYNIINIKILKNDLTSIFGYAVLEVVSGSMEPTIQIGDLIIIDTNEKNYQENDIVTFYDTNDSFVTHRILSIEDDQMITKGDNNNTEDEKTPIQNIVGKYLFRIQGLGTFLLALKNPIVSIMIFVIGILICYFISMKKDEEEEFIEENDAYQTYLEKKLKKEEKEKKKKKSFFAKLKEKLKRKKKPKKKNTKKRKRKEKKKIIKRKNARKSR